MTIRIENSDHTFFRPKYNNSENVDRVTEFTFFAHIYHNWEITEPEIFRAQECIFRINEYDSDRIKNRFLEY